MEQMGKKGVQTMIYFDALTQADCEQIRKWRNEDIAGARTPYLLTEAQQADFYRDVVSNRESEHRYWAVRCAPICDDKECDVCGNNGKGYWLDLPSDLIGIAGLTNIEWENGRAEIALMIGTPYRKQGHGAEALHELFKQGFDRMRLHTIYGNVYGCNASFDFWTNQINKYGMYRASIPFGKWWDGKWYGTRYFQLDSGKWEKV